MELSKHSRTRRFQARPADGSLQAYEDFILGMTLALNPAAKDELTEEQWRGLVMLCQAQNRGKPFGVRGARLSDPTSDDDLRQGTPETQRR